MDREQSMEMGLTYESHKPMKPSAYTQAVAHLEGQVDEIDKAMELLYLRLDSFLTKEDHPTSIMEGKDCHGSSDALMKLHQLSNRLQSIGERMHRLERKIEA